MLSALPIINFGNVCCCLWVICGGVLAAYLDQQKDPTPITPGRGAFTGFLSGMAGAVVWALVSIVVNALLAPIQQRLAGDIVRSRPDLPPEVQRMLESLGQNQALGVVIGFVFMLIVGAIFATLGGLLGAAFFKKDANVPPALGGPPQPPPLPPQ